MSEPAVLLSHYLPMLLDGVMLIAVTGLWLMWWRNAKRQRLVESMLADSVRQLHEASHHLQQAMELINKSTTSTKTPSHKASNRHVKKTPDVREDTQVAQMLNMQREGKPVENIATKLGLPPSQVRLMLKLHASRTN